MFIDPDAEPVRNDPPLSRLRGRKRVITALEILISGDRMPDEAIYEWQIASDRWILKKEYW